MNEEPVQYVHSPCIGRYDNPAQEYGKPIPCAHFQIQRAWSIAYIELRIEASAQQVWLQYGNEYEGRDEAKYLFCLEVIFPNPIFLSSNGKLANTLQARM